MTATVLILTARAEIGSTLDRMLGPWGYRCEMAPTAAEMFARAGKRPAACVVVDMFARSEALRFLRGLSRQSLQLAAIVIADPALPAANTEALRLGAVDIVTSPIREGDLLAAISNAREFDQLATAAAEPPADLPDNGIFAASPRMREVLQVVRRAAASRCPVMVVGEAGSGRELVARTVHAEGSLRESPFVKVVCSRDGNGFDAAPFAGAGAVYFEEIGELSSEAQAALERWLKSDKHPDPRVIAGARPELDGLVDRGLIRRSLVDALAVVRIDLPPLRQRPHDIPLLAVHLLKQACRDQAVSLKIFSRSALALLSALPWYGNAAELRTLAERLAVLVPRGLVLQEDVLQNLKFDGVHTRGGGGQGSLREARDRFEREFISSVLQRHRGRIGAAAKELGIERTNLYRKMKQFKLSSLPKPGKPRL